MRDIIVIGASAGGVEALSDIVAALPAGLPATLFIVNHYPDNATSELPSILSRRGQLLARHPVDQEEFHPGHIYVAPPNHHIVLESKQIRLSRGPRENRVRPAIDPLFRSAAESFGKRVAGVILSGGLSDGVAGLMAVRAFGGVAVVQDPEDASMPSLPMNALALAGADYVATSGEMGPLLVRLATGNGAPVQERPPSNERPDLADEPNACRRMGGHHSHMPCPECGGPLCLLEEQSPYKLRCYIGHEFRAGDVLDEQKQALEAALWSAVRTFKERSLFAHQLGSAERARGNHAKAKRFDEDAALSDNYSEVIRRLLTELAPKMSPGQAN